jgi:uncharacterized protein (TIGR00255 family)
MKSMTGYGRCEETIGNYTVAAEIKSVNHRYGEISVRVPKIYNYLEEYIKTLTTKTVSRGKTDVFITIQKNTGKNTEIAVDLEIVKNYINILKAANEELGLEDDFTLTRVMRIPDAFTVNKVVDDEEEIKSLVTEVFGKALTSFSEMRAFEGDKLYSDLMLRIDLLDGFVGEIEQLMPEQKKVYFGKLYDKIKELISGTNIDESRILTEAAIFAEKVATDEETVRFRSHISQFKKICASSDSIGRKLDFLIQEMNREVNTIGSKVSDIEITKIVIEMKSEIEKIREQVQNIE